METGTHNLNLRVPILVHQAIKEIATKEDRSVTWVINRILTEALAKAKQGTKQ